MITSVDSVIIGKKVNGSATTAEELAIGDVALFNQDRVIITGEEDYKAANAIYFGVAQAKVNVTMPDGSVEQKANIYFSNKLDIKGLKSAVFCEYTAPEEDKVVIDFSNATIITGHRYVVRVLYKDIETPGWQFTHTYEATAPSEDAADLIAELVKKMNKHANRRVVVTSDATSITMTAMPKTDNEGVDSPSEYTTVAMEVTMYKTIPGAMLANFPEKVPGAVITKTQGNPGRGYWKQVRDYERRQQGYKGYKYTDTYPSFVSAMQTVEGAEYDYLSVMGENLYLSNDNQYIKNTPMSVNLFVEKGSLAGSTLLSLLLTGEQAD